MTEFLDAHDAASRLGVSKSTLYAYVSRGLIRSEPIDGTRRHRYRTADVEALVRRRRARREPEAAARGALSFHGMPVLDSALSLIDGGQLFYAGQDAIELARTRALEDVAGMLWGAPFPEDELPWSWSGSGNEPPVQPVHAFHEYLAEAAALDDAAFDLRPPAVRRTGARILRGLAGVAAGMVPEIRSTVDTLLEGWNVRHENARALLQAALVACADHELNVSAFTARCVASAGATPYMAITAALAALQGIKHGGHAYRVAELMDAPQAAELVLSDAMRRDGTVSGFGHPLYPRGDPRGALLLELAPPSPARKRAQSFVNAVAEMTGDRPNLDFGLVVFARALELPYAAPFALFALGRTVGWIAHALEQYAADTLIRPRARYVGPWPQAGETTEPPRT